MSRTTKVRNAKQKLTLTPEARALIAACKDTTRSDRLLIARGLSNAATRGNATAARMLYDLSSLEPPPPKPGEDEPEGAKALTLFENDAPCEELSEETSDWYPSGREPE
jgi:hypothetical protein